MVSVRVQGWCGGFAPVPRRRHERPDGTRSRVCRGAVGRASAWKTGARGPLDSGKRAVRRGVTGPRPWTVGRPGPTAARVAAEQKVSTLALLLRRRRTMVSAGGTCLGTSGSGAAPACSSTCPGASAIHSPTARSGVAPARTAHVVRASRAARRWQALELAQRSTSHREMINPIRPVDPGSGLRVARDHGVHPSAKSTFQFYRLDDSYLSPQLKNSNCDLLESTAPERDERSLGSVGFE